MDKSKKDKAIDYFKNFKGFDTGQLVKTKGVDAKIQENMLFLVDVIQSFQRYERGDFGSMEYIDDILMNYHAVEKDYGRIFATYNTCEGKIYIITEWDRSMTTILFPHEY